MVPRDRPVGMGMGYEVAQSQYNTGHGGSGGGGGADEDKSRESFPSSLGPSGRVHLRNASRKTNSLLYSGYGLGLQ